MTDRDDSLIAQPFDAAGSGSSGERIAATAFEPLSQAVTQRPGLPKGKLALVIAALLLASILFFLLTARSLTLNIAAEGDTSYSLSGWHLPFGERLLIRPGEYELSVRAEGYHPFQETIIVSEADAQQLDIRLAPLPGTLELRSQPTGAEIWLDEVALGSTPLLDQVLEAGTYALTLRLPRYQVWQGAVEITGRNQSQTLDIALLPDWADIQFSTMPAEVSATVDDTPVDITDRGVEVLSGRHTLTLSAPGFVPEKIALDVVAGITQSLGEISLTPADATLSLSSQPAGASVTVDGAFAGQTPLVAALSPATAHTLKISKAGFKAQTLSLTLQQGQRAERNVVLAPELGEVRFTLSPVEAELVVAGRSYGSGSQTLSLPATDQQVVVQLEGYQPFEASIRPRPGLSQQVEVTLLTVSEARKAAMTPTVTTPLGQTLILVDPSSESLNPFTMGASRRDPGRRANEVEHPVQMKRAFYLAETETTNAQFRQFEAAHDSGLIESYSLDRDHQPVVGISWQQAASFCNWLSRVEGLAPFYRENQGIIVGFNPSSTGYRLPTEAEWAFAARVEGETLRRFAWGDDFPPESPVVNVADNTSAFVTGRILNGYTDQFVVSAPVASFPPNHRGLHDMGGNVAEWVHDVYRIPSANAELEVDPMGTQRGDNYTIRGASWALSRLSELRLTFRDYGERGRDDLGFRIARYAE